MASLVRSTRLLAARTQSSVLRRGFASSAHTLYTARAHTVGGRTGESKSDDGALNVKFAMPTTMGGNGGATNPEQLFASGYSACFLGAMGLVAKNAGKQLPSNTAIDAAVDLIKGADGKLSIGVKMDVTAPGWDRATTEDIVKKAHEVCPYSRATKGNIDVKFNVK